MSRRMLLSFLPLAALLLAAVPARAQYIPPEKQADVLGLFAPYDVEAPGDQLPGGAVLDSIQIERVQVTVTVAAGEAKASFVIGQRGEGPPKVLRQTPSFDIWVLEPVGDSTLRQGIRALVDAVAANDAGGFWAELPRGAQTAPGEVALPEAPPEAGMPWYHIAGIVLAVLLLAALILGVPGLVPSLRGTPRFAWVGLALVVALGGGYRYMFLTAESQAEDAVSEWCEKDEQCNDFNDCTRDLCVNRKCTFEWDPPDGLMCCRTDADCAQPEARCTVAFCEADTSQCGERPDPRCDTGQSAREREYPSDAPAVWFVGLAAESADSPADLLGWVNFGLSTLAILLLGLALLVWGAEPGAALAATFLYAIFPPAFLSAVGPGIGGFALVLGLLLMLLTGPLFKGEVPVSPRVRYALAAAAGLTFFLLGASRLGALALLVPGLWLVLRHRRFARVGLGPLVLLAAAVVGAVVFQGVAVSPEHLAAAYPDVALGAGLGAALDVFLLAGNVVPFILWLLVIPGVFVAFGRNRELAGLAALLLVALVATAALFDAEGALLARYAAFSGIGLVVFAGYGLWWIRTRSIRYAWMITAILVLYFAFYPLNRAAAIQTLDRSADFTAPFFQV